MRHSHMSFHVGAPHIQEALNGDGILVDVKVRLFTDCALRNPRPDFTKFTRRNVQHSLLAGVLVVQVSHDDIFGRSRAILGRLLESGIILYSNVVSSHIATENLTNR